MNTQHSSKFAAIAVALMMNMAIFGGVAYLFNGQTHQVLEGASVARSVAPATPVV